MSFWSPWLLALAFADPCAERAQRVRAGEVPFGEEDPDCTDAEKTGALIAWLAAAAAAAAAARQVKEGKSVRPEDWPTDLKGPNAFCDLGHVIAKEEYLQTTIPIAGGGSRGLTDVEKTMYIFERMREAARIYDLRAAQSPFFKIGPIPIPNPKGIWHQGQIVLSRREWWMPTVVIGGVTILGGILGSALLGPGSFLAAAGMSVIGTKLGGILGAAGLATAFGGAAYASGADQAVLSLVDKIPDRWLSFTGGAVGAAIGGITGVALAGAPGAMVGKKLGGLLGAAIGGYLGFHVAQGSLREDSEQLDTLKARGLGDCGDWSLAFKRVLECAGIKQHEVVYADNSPTPVESLGHGGTDTTIVVKDANGKRRVFDIYRQMFHETGNDPTTPSRFSNLPMTVDDKFPYDDSNDSSPLVWQQWLEKPYIKGEKHGVLWQQ